MPGGKALAGATNKARARSKVLICGMVEVRREGDMDDMWEGDVWCGEVKWRGV